MSRESDVVRAALEDWRRRDRVVLASRFAPDAVLHEHASGRTAEGASAIAAMHLGWTEAFPDADGDVEREFSDGELAGYQVVWRGTHDGPLMLPDGTVVPPSGRRIAIPAALIHVVRNDHIVRQDHYFDAVTMLAQLGVMPAGAAA